MKNLPLHPLPNPSRTNQPRLRSRILTSGATSGGAFTLIEMLVVLGIAALVIPILMVSTSLLSQGFGEKQALSQVNSALSLARATAIRDGRDAALLFMADENGTAILQIAVMAREQLNPDLPRFEVVDDRSPDKLGEGIRIVSPNSTTDRYVGPYRGFSEEFLTPQGTSVGNGPNEIRHLAVRFAPDGTIRRVDANGKPARFWFDNHEPEMLFDDGLIRIGDSDVDVDPTFQPVDILALYAKEHAEAFDVASDPQKLKDWINNPQQNEGKAFVILFNRYTGLALRSAN